MRRIVLLLILPAVLPVAMPALASEMVLGVHGGYGAYSQEDLNEVIGLINGRVGDEAVGEVKGGFEYGAHFGLRINATTILGVSYARLDAATAGAGEGETLDVSVPAACWLAFINWLPDSDSVGRIGLGADAGFVTVDGYSRYTSVDQGVDDYETFAGKGLFLSLYVLGDLALSESFSLLASGGFRLAQVPDITVNGASSSSDLDYSGVFVRVGLRYAP